MKSLSESSGKQRLLFFLGGLFVMSICGIVSCVWVSVMPDNNYDDQPIWLKAIFIFISVFPWIALAAVLVFRFTNGRKIRIGFYFLGTITPIVSLAMLLLAFAIFSHDQDFDAEVWRSKKSIEYGTTRWPPRLCMVDNLMSSEKLDSLTKSQVIQLLGPPHDKSFPFGADICDIHYHLGPERGFFSVDCEWLFITFDDNGKVNRYWIYTD